MKNNIIYTISVFLGAMVLMTVVGIAYGLSAGQAARPTDAPGFVNTFCFDGDIPIMDVSDIVDKYTEKTNDYFNKQIRFTMTNPDLPIPTPDIDQYSAVGGGLCRDANGKEVNDLTCQAIAVCNPQSGPDPSAHPFCMSMTLLGIAPARATDYNWERLKDMDQLKYSYFCYKAALETKKDALFDSTPQSMLDKCGTAYEDVELCNLRDKIAAETDSVRQAALQEQMNMILSGKAWWWNERWGSLLSSSTGTLVDVTNAAAKRAKFIEDEIPRAKSALDQTLDAYGQLRKAWQMHVHYKDIFDELVKYRDHIVELRKQTDSFPIRFIDATTTKCL